MKKLMVFPFLLFFSLMMAGVAGATFEEGIIWDPNGRSGVFTDPTPNFATILTQLSAPATILVSGGGGALVTAVATTAVSGDVIEVTDSLTYDGGLEIADKTDIVIRAASGASPVIDCGILPIATTCLFLNPSADGSVKNIGIKGLTFKDIRYNAGNAPTSHGIGSLHNVIIGKLLENIVIEDNVFDNSDFLKDITFKGVAIHINKVDGLLIRRNTIINGGAHGAASPQEDGAITLHEFTAPRLPNYLNNVFIQNNEISFDYSAISGDPAGFSSTTRGIVLAHTGKPTTRFNNVVVEYNLIDNVQKEGIKIFGTSTDGTDDETVHVSNNVIKRTADGIEMDGGVLIINRTIFDGLTSFGAEGKDDAINRDGGAVTVSNSIVINKLDGVTGSPVTLTCIDLFNPSLTHPTSSVLGTIFNVDPIFVDTSINDYEIGNSAFPAGCAGGSFGLELISPPGKAPDHFQCYKVGKSTKLDPKPVVDLEDQFGLKEDVKVKDKAKFFCAPVHKDLTLADDLFGPHLTCYDIKGTDPKVEVTVDNQLGQGQIFDLKKGKLLCVPSVKTDVNPLP